MNRIDRKYDVPIRGLWVLVLACLLMVGVGSCVKLIETDFPDYERQLVVNGVLRVDSLLRVHVSWTGNLSDTALAVVDDAEVVMQYGDTFLRVDTLRYEGDGWYVGDDVAHIGCSYTCMVMTSDSAFVELKQAQVPEPAKIVDVRVDIEPFMEEGSFYRRFHVTFERDTRGRAYYELRLWTDYETGDLDYMYVDASSDVVFQHEASPLKVFRSDYMTDDTFTVTGVAYVPPLTDPDYISKHTIELRSVDRSYYDYMKGASVDRYDVTGILMSYSSTMVEVEL